MMNYKTLERGLAAVADIAKNATSAPPEKKGVARTSASEVTAGDEKSRRLSERWKSALPESHL